MIKQTLPKKTKDNPTTRKNQLLFGITMVIFQIIVSIVYGTMCNVQNTQLNIGSVIAPIFLSLFAVVGFSLHLSYFRRLNHLAMTYCLLITALCIEFYPLLNAFWAKVSISNSTLYDDSFNVKDFSVFLATRDSTANLNNTLTAAIKCSIAIIVALSSLIGRIGPLQCFILTTIGTIGYQLNRRIINNMGQDIFGSFSIFTYGGFMGLTAGIISSLSQKKRIEALSQEQKRKLDTAKNMLLVSKGSSQIIFCVGGLFLFIFFPYLAFQGEQSFKTSDFHNYNTALSIILSMCSSVLSTIIASSLFNGSINMQFKPSQLSSAIIAGAITTGAASFYIVTPFLALVSGSVAGFTQNIYENLIDKQIKKKLRLISTYSFSVFCLQGLNGALFAAGYNKRLSSIGTGDYIFQGNLENAGYEILIYLISCGIGIVFGGIVGFFVYFLNNYQVKEMFSDRTQIFRKDHIINNTKQTGNIHVQIPKQNKPDNDVHPEPEVPASGMTQSQSSIQQMQFQFFDMLQADFM